MGCIIPCKFTTKTAKVINILSVIAFSQIMLWCEPDSGGPRLWLCWPERNHTTAINDLQQMEYLLPDWVVIMIHYQWFNNGHCNFMSVYCVRVQKARFLLRMRRRLCGHMLSRLPGSKLHRTAQPILFIYCLAVTAKRALDIWESN